MASLSTCHLGLWLGWQILLNLVISNCRIAIDCVYHGLCAGTENWLAKEVLDQRDEGKRKIDYEKPCDIQVSVFITYLGFS